MLANFCTRLDLVNIITMAALKKKILSFFVLYGTLCYIHFLSLLFPYIDGACFLNCALRISLSSFSVKLSFKQLHPNGRVYS